MIRDRPPTPLDDLNPRHRLWVLHYVRHNFNASAADREVGYRDVGRHGYKLKQRPDIQRAITHLLDQMVMGSDEVLYRLSDHARADLGDFIKYEQTPQYDTNHMPIIDPDTGEQKLEVRVWIDLEKARQADKTHLIRKVKQLKDGSIELELHDSQSALQLLARHHSLLHDSTTNLNVELGDLTDEQLARIADGEDPVKVVGGQ